MEILKTLVWIVNLISAFSIIGLVLMQHGKGADAGAAFGSGGGSAGVFGAAGSANFLSRATAISAVVFLSTCIGLTLLSSSVGAGLGVMEKHVEQSQAPVSSSAGQTQQKAPAPVIPE